MRKRGCFWPERNINLVLLLYSIAFPCLPLPLASSTKCRCHQPFFSKGK